MADTDRPEERTVPDEEGMDSEEAIELLSKLTEARRALPWDQWTMREKASYYMDRLFLAFLVVFLLVFVGEIVYKVWYISNVNKVGEFVKSSMLYLFSWLFSQDRDKQLAEL